MSQTSYSLNQPVAVKGLIGDLNPHTIDSYNNPVDTITPGYAVEKVATDEDGIQIPDGTGFVLAGIAVRSLSKVDPETYPALSAVPVLKRGRVWVVAAEAVTADDAVYVVYSGATAGQFRNDNTNADAVANAKFLKYDATTGLALLDINLD